MKVACAWDGAFTTHDLGQHVDIAASRIGLCMSFLCSCKLLERAPGRGTYRATKTGAALAAPWLRSEQQGRSALRAALQSIWFVEAAHTRLGTDPGLASGLTAHLLSQARAGADKSLAAEVLVDFMIQSGFLQVDKPGYLRWHAAATPESADPGVGPNEQTSEVSPSGPAPATGGAGIPRPRTEPPQIAGNGDIAALLASPIRIVDLGRLSTDDLDALHRHLRGLASVIDKIKGLPTDRPI
ncbi:hypothetical protein OG607_26400 [Streptomyces sp. NBC_01537]|uniref:hypothetical protein n=1 Tax=Streptomyces sp. NBC_01537 TaxID=2903896 RepID=UPI0038667B65